MNKVSPLRALATILIVGVVSFGFAFFTTYLTKYGTLRAAEVAFASSPQSPKVVYLTPAGDLLPHLAGTAERGGGVILNDADLVPLLDDSMRIDVLIFDSTIRDKLDSSWLQRRYLEGMVVVALNTPINELATLVNDSAAISGPWENAGPLEDGPYFSMLYFSISGADQADIDRYMSEAHLYQDPDGGGSVVPGIESELHVSRGRAQSYLMDEQAADVLWMNLQNIVTSIKARQQSNFIQEK